MGRATAADVPAENSILCEYCGYTLDGLPIDGNCPECGKPVALSTTEDGRQPAEFDRPGKGRWLRFLRTAAGVTFRPSHFFRHTTARDEGSAAFTFAMVFWIVSAALFGAAAYLHSSWYATMTGWTFVRWPFLIALIVATFFGLWGITNLASRLTVWEARYRGYRLPRSVVLRGLYYHAAHYLPVGLVAFLTTAGYLFCYRRNLLGPTTADRYLIALSVEVVVAAMYLFWTYWAAMRNMMYANR